MQILKLEFPTPESFYLTTTSGIFTAGIDEFEGEFLLGGSWGPETGLEGADAWYELDEWESQLARSGKLPSFRRDDDGVPYYPTMEAARKALTAILHKAVNAMGNWDAVKVGFNG